MDPRSAAGTATRWARKVWWLVLAAFVASLVIGVAVFRQRRVTTATDFDAFWQPVFSQSTPVLVGLAHPLVYRPSGRLAQLDEQRNGPQATVQRPVNVPFDQFEVE